MLQCLTDLFVAHTSVGGMKMGPPWLGAQATSLLALLVFQIVLLSGGYNIPLNERTYTRVVPPPSRHRQQFEGARNTDAAQPPYCFVPPLPVPLPAGSLDEVIRTLDSNISALWLANAGIMPGSLSVNLIYDQDVVWHKGYGVKNHSNPSSDAPDGDTAYRVGSISKVFTTLLALMLRDLKTWELDDRLQDIVPDFGVVDPFESDRGITLRQLASHMAGLSREAPCANMYSTGCKDSEQVVLDRLKTLPLVRPPGLKPSYSNLGFALLGIAEAHKMQKSWVELVNRVSQLLKQNNTHPDIPPRPAGNIAEGYMPGGLVADWIDIGFEAPAGQMFSSTSDLAKLIHQVFRTRLPMDLESGQLLGGETLREWMHPVYMSSDLSGFGLVWELFQGGPYNFRSKDGAINGYRAIMLFVPEIKVGAVALLGNENSALLSEVASSLVIAVLQVSDVMALHQVSPPLPPSPSDYVGMYSHTSDIPMLKGQANISLETVSDGHQQLVLTGIGHGGVLVWLRGDTFQLTDRFTLHYCSSETSGSDDFYIVFSRDSQDKVISATAPGFMYGYVLTKQP